MTGGITGKMAGVALITSLLLLAIVTLLVTAMTTRQQLDLQRGTHLSHAEQAHWYAFSAENWAKRILNSDNRQIDSLSDNWAVSVPPLAIEEGRVAGSITDLQGLFNLNNLLQAGEPHPLSVTRFKRLLEELKIDTDILPALLDWLDDDNIESAGGAEDHYYATLQPGYRAANQLLADPSELRLIRGVTAEIYAKLQPYITALPIPTGINVNTAPATILKTLASNDGLDVEAVIYDRQRTAFKDLEFFRSYFTETKNKAEAEQHIDGLSIASSYFLMVTAVELGVSRVSRQSLLYRTGEATVTLRQFPVYRQ